MMKKTLAVTVGEPSGIGPDCLIKFLHQDWQKGTDIRLKIFAPPELLLDRAKLMGLSIEEQLDAHNILFEPLAISKPVQPGKLDVNNAEFVYNSLIAATSACLSGQCCGLVTGPLHKALLNQANIPFSGHTEFLAEQANVEQTLMLFVSSNQKVGLVTTHIPLSKVSSTITQTLLAKCIELLRDGLEQYFGIPSPHIGILSINPHAGEQGYLGSEEILVQQPIINKLRGAGYRLSEPLAADTAFNPDIMRQYDALLAMYHDQALPAIKTRGFGHAVNVTLGLPFLRTSVDHGTALDIAGSGQVDAMGFSNAVSLQLALHCKELEIHHA